MGIWWSGILVPVGILLGLLAWHSVENAGGPDGGRTPVEIQILLVAALYGGIGALAVFGTLASRIAKVLQERTFD